MSNLPPGVNVNMIPGNRPEDEAEEKFWDTFITKLEEAKIPQPLLDEWIGTDDWQKAVIIARDMGYAQGYNEGSLNREVIDAEQHLD